MEEHNVNALTLWYNVNEEPPLSDLKIFQRRATTTLYNEFDKQNWRSHRQPINKHLVVMWWCGINGGPNFIDWFWIHIQSSCDFFPPLIYKLLVIFMYKLHILFNAPKMRTSMMTYDSYPMGVLLLEAMVDMMSMAFASSQPHLRPHVLEQPQSTQELWLR
jgi:hypothetical protein